MINKTYLAMGRAMRVWRRNALVWRRSAGRSLLGSFADPLLYLLALGYGLGSFIPNINGVQYITFLCTGIIATSAMNAATFEGLYLTYTRMAVQHTWNDILNAPITLKEIVIGELLWMGTKSMISGTAILLVSFALGLIHNWLSIWIIPLAFFTGLTFGSMALVVTSLSYSYDFFMYYMTLIITPTVLLSGVFFPASSLPDVTQSFTVFFPLSHIVTIIRSLAYPQIKEQGIWLHLLIPALFFLSCTFFSIYRLNKRLLK